MGKCNMVRACEGETVCALNEDTLYERTDLGERSLRRSLSALKDV